MKRWLHGTVMSIAAADRLLLSYATPHADHRPAGGRMSRRTLRRAGSAAVAVALLSGCAFPSQTANLYAAKRDLAFFRSAAQQAVTCRAAATANPRYAILAPHVDLNDVGTTTLPQMIDPALATPAETAALHAWAREVNTCREQLLVSVESTLPSFGPLIERGRDDDDAIFVKLAEHKISWGEAVVALKTNRTNLRGDIVAKADQVDANFNKLRQDQLNRRADLLSSAIRILP
jgi:hypothetical protein